MIFELNHACLCLGTIGLIVAPWKFDVLKTSVFSVEVSHLGRIFICFKDLHADCLCASLLRTRINMPRHASSARAKY